MQVKSHALLGQLGDMDLRLLRVFKTVVDCGGMAAAESLDSRPQLHPELLIWLPNVVCQAIGLVGIWRKR